MYYIYLYLDPRFLNEEWGFQPIYIGRGKGSRDKSHLAEAKKYKGASIDVAKTKRLNMLKINKINAIRNTGVEPIIIHVLEHLTFEDSKTKEIELIAKIGRSFLGEGPLTNLTSGGEGRHVCHAGPFNPFYGKTCSDTNKALLSKVHRGKIISDDHRLSISKALKGKTKSHETKEAMKSSMRKRFLENPDQKMFQIRGDAMRKTWEIKTPEDNILIVKSLSTFCKENGLSYTTLLSAFKKNRPVFSGSSAGWQIMRTIPT